MERQKPIPVVYKDVRLECGYRTDLLIESRIVVGLKSIEAFAPIHQVIILTYIRLSGRRLGLLTKLSKPVLANKLSSVALWKEKRCRMAPVFDLTYLNPS